MKGSAGRALVVSVEICSLCLQQTAPSRIDLIASILFGDGAAAAVVSGGPADSTLFYSLYLYQEGFVNFDMGYAAAMAWMLVLLAGAVVAVNFVFSRYWVHYEN